MWTLHLICQARERKTALIIPSTSPLLFSISRTSPPARATPGSPSEILPCSGVAMAAAQPRCPLWCQQWIPRLTRCGMHCLMLEQKYRSVKGREISPPMLRESSQENKIPIKCGFSLVDLFERNLFRLRTATRAKQNSLFSDCKKRAKFCNGKLWRLLSKH